MIVKTILLFISSAILFFCGNNLGIKEKSTDRANESQATLADFNKYNDAFLQDSLAHYSKISKASAIEVLSLRKIMDTTSKFLKLYIGNAKIGIWVKNKL